MARDVNHNEQCVQRCSNSRIYREYTYMYMYINVYKYIQKIDQLAGARAVCVLATQIRANVKHVSINVQQALSIIGFRNLFAYNVNYYMCIST